MAGVDVNERLMMDITDPSTSDLTPADFQSWSLPTVLAAQAEARPDAPFLTDCDGRTLSYSDVYDRACSLARGLRELGVCPGDTVMLMGANRSEYLIAWFAANLLGAVEVPVNAALRGASLVHVVNNAKIKVAFVDKYSAGLLSNISSELPHLSHVVLWDTEETRRDLSLPWATSCCSSLEQCQPDADLPVVKATDLGAIMYTSGTTGPSKGVLMAHAHLYLFAYQMVEVLQLNPNDRYLVTLPLFHANAQLMQVYASMIAGSHVFLCERFSASGWLSTVHSTGATVSSILGVMAQFIFSQPESEADASHQLRRMITIPMPADIGECFESRFGVRCIDAYGMTEICVPIHDSLDSRLKPGSCGKADTRWFDVRIADPETDLPVADGTVGEILIRPRVPWTIVTGYQSMPEKTVEAWRNYWFHTGDAATRDQDGFYYYVDRLQDRIRRRGENISSFEVEASALRYPGVLAAAAVGVPAQEGDNEIALFLAAPGVEICFDDLMKLMERDLPYFALPRYIIVRPELPTTATGKVLKRNLKGEVFSNNTWDRIAAGYQVQR